MWLSSILIPQKFKFPHTFALKMQIKPNILFVCTVNRARSATAEKMYENDERFYVDSAGTDQAANVLIEEWHLEWADYILVMERVHQRKIKEMFPKLYKKDQIICLHIPDIFRFMQPELVAILEEKVEVACLGILGK